MAKYKCHNCGNIFYKYQTKFSSNPDCPECGSNDVSYIGTDREQKMKCYNCGLRLYSKYKYCPECGKAMSMCSKKIWITTLSDSAQANRIEKKLDETIKLLKKLKK